MRITAAARSVTGHVRRHNEDCLYAGERLWVVADGMGGHAAGDVASALVIARLRALDAAATIDYLDIPVAISAANADVLQHGDDHPESYGLGSTVAGLAAVVAGDVPQWAVFNVGDSRVYRFADGTLTQVTVDHSEIEELVMLGVISAEAARTHPARHVITRSVGLPDEPRADLWLLPQVPGERFLVCSDGLPSEVPDEEIALLLGADLDAEQASEVLVASALAAGGHDNISVIVIDVADG